ncbi:PPE family protein [Mycolicibacterium aurum]|uniref:PPE family protein n=1 Tax=Mycolicibacterium aurum TaxID=1791 RepID=A0A448IET6_MYCAU|nr:PPE domain-containing protein [Mycolicibacterium aurum]VEG50981.1 PPE family protein [Mycolicibacterium aurum]
MAGDELKVDPSDLETKAGTIEAIPWGANPASATLADPDKLTATTAAVRNLGKNAEALGAEQQWGMAESRRLAETLRLVGRAYQAVDEASATTIDSTIPGGSGGAPAPAPVPIGANTLPAPPPPPAMPGFENVASDGDILDPIETDNKLAEGDHAAALRTAAAEWTANAARLTEAAIPFEVKIQNWEGVAAEAAYVKFKSFGGWLQALAGKWTQLAAEAEKLAIAHDQAAAANAPVRAQYEALRTQLMSTPMDGGARRALQLRMEQLYQESETIREGYANAARPTPVQPPQPRPDSAAPTSPVTGNGDPRARGVPAQAEGERQAAAGGGGSQPQAGGGGGQGGQPPLPQEAPVSPMSAADQAQQAAQQGSQQGGAPGGGSPGGGSEGGGSKGGGAPGGGMPSPTKGEPQLPKLPTDPSLRPAAAGGGGGGSGGGGGGGVPASPLQPAVGAETVAPAPVVGPAVPVAAAGATSGSGGAMGGGMGGGMAPMMHGAQGGSGEKKRNPQLSEDVPLYVEDRPHTEQVIGVRPRRRGGPDDAKKGETQ